MWELNIMKNKGKVKVNNSKKEGGMVINRKSLNFLNYNINLKWI